MSTDDHIENVYPGVVVHIYHYPRKVFGAMHDYVLEHFGEYTSTPQW